MLLLLGILIISGVIVTIIAFLPSSPNANIQSSQQDRFQDEVSVALKDLSEKVSFLAVGLKQTKQTYATTHDELQQLKKDSFRLFDQLLKQKTPDDISSEVSKLKHENTVLKEDVKRLLSLDAKNKQLLAEIAAVKTALEQLNLKSKKQDKFVLQLQEKEEKLKKELEELNTSLEKVNIELEQTRKREAKTKKDLFKYKVISAEAEKELEHIREENDNLQDGLIYELNN